MGKLKQWDWWWPERRPSWPSLDFLTAEAFKTVKWVLFSHLLSLLFLLSFFLLSFLFFFSGTGSHYVALAFITISSKGSFPAAGSQRPYLPLAITGGPYSLFPLSWTSSSVFIFLVTSEHEWDCNYTPFFISHHGYKLILGYLLHESSCSLTTIYFSSLVSRWERTRPWTTEIPRVSSPSWVNLKVQDLIPALSIMQQKDSFPEIFIV